MINISSILIDKLPFELDKFVGVLLYHEFPITTIYSDNNDEPIIKEWVDCEEGVDRYFIYRVNKESLKQFVEGDMSHYDLYFDLKDGIGFLIEEKNGKNIINYVISPSHLPNEYLPIIDSFFKPESGVDTNKIANYYHLDQIKIEKKNYDDELKELSENRNSQLFNLHLTKGIGIGYGRINTDILAETLLNFVNLYKEVSLDYLFGCNRGEIKLSHKEKEKKLMPYNTEVILSKASSFSIFIKPKYYSETNMFENKTVTEAITHNLYNLFEISHEQTILNEKYSIFSGFVFKTYKEFLKNIIEYNITFELNWINSTQDVLLKEDFSLLKADKIINSIDNIVYEEPEDFNVIGKFTAINCNTAYFTFKSHNDDIYNGYFQKLIRESIHRLNFTSLYEIRIERKILHEAGTPEPKIKDFIVSCIPIKDE